MVTNILPTFIGFILVGKYHIFTHYMWTFYASNFASLAHCGYDLPWYPWGIFPLGAPIEYHDYHHSANLGNYGAFSTFWDSFCGTDKHFMKFLAKKSKKNS